MKLTRLLGAIGVIGGLSLPLLAKCPIPDGGTVVIRAAAGDLQVDTSSREASVEVSVDGAPVQESCNGQIVEFTGTSTTAAKWKIVTPKNVNLDLVTMAGNIHVTDIDGNAILRTAGGSVTAGNIKGKGSLITQGGFIKAGNIGGDAELRSQGGALEVGDIGGNAEFNTTAGIIRAGNISGNTVAVGGRVISIAKGADVKVTTPAGDISIGDATRINAKSGEGHITSKRVSGPFTGHTETGDIRVDSAGASVEAYTGQGNIMVRSVPVNFDGDLHMDLQAGLGDVTVYLPQRLKASVNATVQRPAFQQQQIVTDFPVIPARPAQGLIPANKFYSPMKSESLLNGGGNMIVLHTSLGKINIRKY